MAMREGGAVRYTPLSIEIREDESSSDSMPSTAFLKALTCLLLSERTSPTPFRATMPLYAGKLAIKAVMPDNIKRTSSEL